MTPERRQRILLAGLLGILVLVGARAVLKTVGGPGGGAVRTGARTTDSNVSIESVERLRMADLELEPEEFQLGRDPFRFAVAPPPPPPPPPPRPVRNAAENQPRRPQPRAQKMSPAKPQPPPVDVVYLGRFGSTSRPIAVFSDGKEIFNAFEGGVLKEKFVVDKIGYESADLKFVGFPDAPSQRLAVGG